MKERFDRADLLRLGAGVAAVGAVPKSFLTALSSSKGFPQPHPRWRFVFVNHALTNPFFVPAKNGSHDAASLFGVDVKWAGSTRSDVGQMVKAMRHAIASKADGIAVSLIDPTAFNGATRLALSHGIPVVSYNADGGKQNRRLAYIGQDNYQSGLELGARMAHLCSAGDAYLFITPEYNHSVPAVLKNAIDSVFASHAFRNKPAAFVG